MKIIVGLNGLIRPKNKHTLTLAWTQPRVLQITQTNNVLSVQPVILPPTQMIHTSRIG